jgi:MSHA pilin protein MshA
LFIKVTIKYSLLQAEIHVRSSAMKRQAGFTLIELVMVIVILGILSAFALPRFADLGGEARAASLKGAFGAVKSASAIAHADCLVTNCTNRSTDPDQVTLEGSDIAMAFGYPDEDGIIIAAQIAADFTMTGTDPLQIQANGATTPGDCQFTYTEAASALAPPVISVVTDSGC